MVCLVLNKEACNRAEVMREAKEAVMMSAKMEWGVGVGSDRPWPRTSAESQRALFPSKLKKDFWGVGWARSTVSGSGIKIKSGNSHLTPI